MGVGLGNDKKIQQLLVWLKRKAKWRHRVTKGPPMRQSVDEAETLCKGEMQRVTREPDGGRSRSIGGARASTLLVSLESVRNRIQKREDVRTPAWGHTHLAHLHSTPTAPYRVSAFPAHGKTWGGEW